MYESEEPPMKKYLKDLPAPEMPEDTVTYRAYKIDPETDGHYRCRKKIRGLTIGWDNEDDVCVLVTEDPDYMELSVEQLLLLALSEKDAKKLLEDASVTKIENHVGRCERVFPLPPGITREYYETVDGALEKYSAYVKDALIAEYDNEDLTILDNEEENGGIWTTDLLASFLNALPEWSRIRKIQAYRVEKLVLPFTCCVIEENALQLPNCTALHIKRSNMNIGEGNLEGKNIYGIAGSTAEKMAKKYNLPFTPCYQCAPAPKDVKPFAGWEFSAPKESIYIPETPKKCAELDSVNLPGGRFTFIAFQEFEHDDETYKQTGHFISLFCDADMEIGILLQFGQDPLGISVQKFDFTIAENGSLEVLDIINYGNDKEQIMQELLAGFNILSSGRHFGKPVFPGPFPQAELEEILEEELKDSKSISDLIDELHDISSRLRALTGSDDEDESDKEDKSQREDESEEDTDFNYISTERSTQITVADDWTVVIPGGYLYSTDPNTIGENHCILIMKDDETADFEAPFDASEVFVCMSSRGQYLSGDLLEYNNKLRADVLMDLNHSDHFYECEYKENDLILKRTSDVIVYCVVLPNYYDDDELGDKFEVHILTRKGLYFMQAFFHGPGTLEDFGNRFLSILGSIGTVSDLSPAYCLRNFYTLNKEIPIVMPDRQDTYRAMISVQRNKPAVRRLIEIGMHINDSVEYGLSMIEDIVVPHFPLSRTAWEMTDIFRTDEDFYDPDFDREGEIRHGYVREIEHFSAFRSFAWCVAEYCQQNEASKGELDLKTLLTLAQIVDSRSFINYNEEHYPVICGVPDMETFYLPRGRNCPQARELLDEYGEHWGVADLYQLREELMELYPCIEKIYHWLDQQRHDRTKPLRGIHSDIVYVWCALSLAANRAFATTPDVPMNYDFFYAPNEDFSDFLPPVLS